MRDTFASLNEDLTDEPIRAALQAALRGLVANAADPRQVVEAAFIAAAALSLDVSGLSKTALYMLDVGTRLANASPEIQGIAAANLRAIQDVRAELDKPGSPRGDH